LILGVDIGFLSKKEAEAYPVGFMRNIYTLYFDAGTAYRQ